MDNRETLTPSSGDAILKRHLFSEVARNWIKGRGHIERAYFVRRPSRQSFGFRVAASSGPIPKAPGSAGGYLLRHNGEQSRAEFSMESFYDGPYFADPDFAIVPAVLVVRAQDRIDGVCRDRSCGLRLQSVVGQLWYQWQRGACSGQRGCVCGRATLRFRRHGGAREAFGDLGQGHD